MDLTILNKKEVNIINNMVSELTDNNNKRQVFRTETEMRMSVLNDGKFPTPASKYWQSVREMGVMYDELITANFHYNRVKVKIKREQKIIDTSSDLLDIEDARINLAEEQWKLDNIEATARDRYREITLWSRIKAELDDGSFDTKDVNTHQLVSYINSLKNRAACLSGTDSQGEVLNIVGPLKSALKILKKEGKELPKEDNKILEMLYE
jgi:hypothetical protein